jgi:hypothetical protein
MSGFNLIKDKLHQFTRKFYVNELIKGIILFFSLGFIYLFFTLFLESFLWLKPTARTILFWLFIFVQGFLLVRFIASPILKLVGLKKGITLQESSKIIGKHFPEVKDKLLNILQLKGAVNQSDLLLASINQKSEELQPIPFIKAIDFRKNSKHLKFAVVPILIWVLILSTGNNTVFKESLDRVVNHKRAYEPPAPFRFNLKNKSLQVIQGADITVSFQVLGSTLPSEVQVVFGGQSYYIQNIGLGEFAYTFTGVQQPVTFFLEANGLKSKEYELLVINTPKINNVFIKLKYPQYLNKIEETIPNLGNILIPEGTEITWLVDATQAAEVVFISDKRREQFIKRTKNKFEFSKQVLSSLNYQITSSNSNLKDYENLQFSAGVIKDEMPNIFVRINIDTVSRGSAQFAGQLSDDYGLTKLDLVYYAADNPQDIKKHVIPISKSSAQTFYYQFPDGLTLQDGVNYELFFEVFDNDGINGHKKARSTVFKYRQKTNNEIEDELLQEQKRAVSSLESIIQKKQKQQEGLEQLQEELQKKEKVSWNDKNKVERLVKQQLQYKKMMQRQTARLQENLSEKKELNNTFQEKKEELKKRIEELRRIDKQEQLLAEIAALAKKLNKDDLVKKARELAQQNKQQERSLERTLELVKRFYVEQKTMQIANKLEELATKQKDLEKEEGLNLEAQQEVQLAFNKLKKELEEVGKDNEKLKEPIELPDVKEEEEAIDKLLDKANENLKQLQDSEAKESQKKSAGKMKEMSVKMQKAVLDMEGESMEENIEDLRKILENLLLFSFKQEEVMNKFSVISTTHPDFGKDLKKQNDIRSYFEHIDDSLYVLSMRLPKISTKIQDDLSAAHYNLEQSLENFSEDRFDYGISNQRYVMTAANNLADYLSNMLNSMKNASMKMGKGKGKGMGFSLPDIIKKQDEVSEKMKQGMKKGEKGENKLGGKKGDGNKKPGGKVASDKNSEKGEKGKEGKGTASENDDLDGELYEIYKQQSRLRQQLQEAIKEGENEESNGNGEAKRVLKTMEQLENEILEKGFNTETIQKMQQLNYDLLKLEKASLEQGKDNKREAAIGQKETQNKNRKALLFKKQFYNQIEILNRQSLPLQQNYKLKVREYFSEPKIKEK